MKRRRRRRGLGIAPCETYPDNMKGICQIVEKQQHGRVRRSNRRGDAGELDLFTASAIMAVYDGLQPDNRVKYAAMPLHQMRDLALKMLK